MSGRTFPIALVALLAFAGVAAAEDGSSGTSSPPSCEPEEPCPERCDPTTASSPCPPECTAEKPCPPDCTPEHPCPSTCHPDTPCSDPQFKECLSQTQDESACKDDYCARNAEEANEWCARHCRQDPSRAACPKPGVGDGNVPEGARPCLRAAGNDSARREHCIKEFCAEHPRACKVFCEDHPRARMCTFTPKGDERHIAFEPYAEGDGFANLTVDGVLILASVRMGATGAFESKHTDHTLVVRAEDGVLELHDNANGFLRFEGDATLTLAFPEGVTHTLGQGPRTGASKVHYPGGGMAMVESDGLLWVDDRTVVVTGFMSFHIVAGQFIAPHGDPVVREKIKEALQEGDKVGAEIRFNKRDCSQDEETVDRDRCSEVFAYDQVRVKMKHAKDRPTEADPLRITLSADLTEGRTFVVHINKTVLDVGEDRLKLRYFDLPDGENGTTKTEVLFLRAASLDDILDPTDDGGQPEYWVVRDANGLQVLVTVPHWSVHMIELSSLAEILPPSVLVGIAAGAAGILIAAVVLFVPRRRED